MEKLVVTQKFVLREHLKNFFWQVHPLKRESFWPKSVFLIPFFRDLLKYGEEEI